MDDKIQATEANAQTIASGEEVAVTLPTEDDLEAKNAALEAEKARLIVESANYKAAYFKEKSKKKDEDFEPEESEEERLQRIVDERLANSRLAEIAREQDAIIQKALKENKELKLAQLNKTDIPASIGSHSEGQPVKDTLITPEQLAAFKAMKWSDKDIERYKRNLLRNGGR